MPKPAPTLRTPYQPPTHLHSHGLTLFCDILILASDILYALCRRFQLTNFEDNVVPTTARVVKCLGAMLSLRLTLLSAPERITPRQMLRLARAAAILQRLTGKTFDFTLWTGLAPEELEAYDQFNPPPPSRKASPSRSHAPSSSPFPMFPGLNPLAACPQIRARGICFNPGAALANFCRDIIRLMPKDFVFDGGIAAPALTSPSANPLATQPENAPSISSPSPSPSQSPSIPHSDSCLLSPESSIPHSSSLPPSPHPPP